MSGCDRCGYLSGKHDAACPNALSGVAQVQALKVWFDGFRKGRSGAKKPADASRTYSLGFGIGAKALEEAENGQPWVDPDAGFEEYGEFEDVHLDDPD